MYLRRKSKGLHIISVLYSTNLFSTETQVNSSDTVIQLLMDMLDLTNQVNGWVSMRVRFLTVEVEIYR